MRYKIITALGVLAAITGLASSAHAQSAVASHSETGNFTLSDASSVEIESRSVADDYETFFGEEENPSANSLNNGGFNTLINEPRGVEINEELELLVNEPFSPEINPIFSRDAERFDGVDRVEVQYEVTE
jgi:hypothetical protein